MTTKNSPTTEEPKPKKLIFETYLQIVKNSPGSKLFRNLYIEGPDKKRQDALFNGALSCAVFVSSILVIFHKIGRVHATVASTIKDLEESGWQIVKEPKPGDVIIWKKILIDGDWHEHMGFYVGDDKAVSNSWKKCVPVEHHYKFAPNQRGIDRILRFSDWSGSTEG